MARAASALTIKGAWRPAVQRVVGPVHVRRSQRRDRRAAKRKAVPGPEAKQLEEAPLDLPPLLTPAPETPAPEEAAPRSPAPTTPVQPLRPPVLDVPPASLPPAIEDEPEGLPPPVRATAPREWNLWELEGIAREAAGRNELRDTDRSLVLLYLRPFASAEGILPMNFDDLVRESFGELLATREPA